MGQPPIFIKFYSNFFVLRRLTKPIIPPDKANTAPIIPTLALSSITAFADTLTVRFRRKIHILEFYQTLTVFKTKTHIQLNIR